MEWSRTGEGPERHHGRVVDMAGNGVGVVQGCPTATGAREYLQLRDIGTWTARSNPRVRTRGRRSRREDATIRADRFTALALRSEMRVCIPQRRSWVVVGLRSHGIAPARRAPHNRTRLAYREKGNMVASRPVDQGVGRPGGIMNRNGRGEDLIVGLWNGNTV